MLSTVIQRYDKKKTFQFYPVDYLKFYLLSDATFYDSINTIYKFIKTFLGKKKNVLSVTSFTHCSLETPKRINDK